MNKSIRFLYIILIYKINKFYYDLYYQNEDICYIQELNYKILSNDKIYQISVDIIIEQKNIICSYIKNCIIDDELENFNECIDNVVNYNYDRICFYQKYEDYCEYLTYKNYSLFNYFISIFITLFLLFIIYYFEKYILKKMIRILFHNKYNKNDIYTDYKV